MNMLSAVVAQTEDEIILIDESELIHGPISVEYTCQLIACEDMELKIIGLDYQFNITDLHRVSWAGFVNGSLSWQLIVNHDITMSQIKEKIIIGDNVNIEKEDLPNNIFTDNQNTDIPTLNPISECQLDRCHNVEGISEGILYTGALDSELDKDVIKINGNNGDIILIKDMMSTMHMNIQLWSSEEEIKLTFDNLSFSEDKERYFEYPKNNLWLRIVPSEVMSYSPYQFKIVRYDASMESPDQRELNNPWDHGPSLDFGNYYFGHIGSSDINGDSVQINVGKKMTIFPVCEFTEEVNIEIIIHEIENRLKIYDQNTKFCPEEIYLDDKVESIEFRIRSNLSMSWMIGLQTNTFGDGGKIGDAPDQIWVDGNINDNWTLINYDTNNYIGTMGINDDIDIYAFEVKNTNGSYVYLNETEGEINIIILILNQETGAIMNYTNGTEIIAPEGIHALRIEKVNGDTSYLEYSFIMPEMEDYYYDSAELEDLSNLFTNFYIFVGVMFLSPMIVVIWWNRNDIRGESKKVILEEHELNRLTSLRRRISDNLDKEVIISSLHQLGDSPWKIVIEEWGNPLLSYMTNQIEICMWKINSKKTDILLGINTSVKWDMAAIRIFASEGPTIEISEVTPEKLFDMDEIFLNTLFKNYNIFIKIKLKKKPRRIDFQLTGLVDGKPVASSSRRAVTWSEEE